MSEHGRTESSRTPQTSRAATLFGVVALISIAVGTFEPFYFQIYRIDRAAFRETLRQLPYRQIPQLRELFDEVARNTEPGDRIAFVSQLRWEEGYDYIFARAAYNLPGREVIAVREPDDTVHPERIAGASHVLYWGMEPLPIPGQRVFDDFGAVLVRRSE